MGFCASEDEIKESNDGHFDLDTVLEAINPIGKFQLRMAFLLWISTASAGIGVVSFSFTALVPQSRCAVPACEQTANATYKSEEGTYPEFFTSLFGDNRPPSKASLDCKVPMPKSRDRSSPLGGTLGSQETCDSYVSRALAGGEMGQCSPDQLIFDESMVKSSIVRDLDFVCGKSFLRNIFSALYMLGMLVGAFVLGIFSDRNGRRPALLVSVLLLSIPGSLAAFVKIPALFGFLRFLCGMGGMGLFMISYVMILENTTPKYIVALGTITAVGFTMGELLFVLAAYLIRDWVTLQLVLHVPMLIGVILFFVVPESVRWMISKGRIAEARHAIKKVAEVNGRQIPHHLLYPSNVSGMKMESSAEPVPTIADLFKTRTIALRSLNMFYQWFSVTMAYYGITFATTSLAGDPYLNFMLGALTEFPGVLFGYFAINIIGRRFILSFLQSLAGVACIISGLLVLVPSLKVLQVILAMVGKFGATCAFGTVYLYTSELFPTPIRGTAVGTSSTVARVGGITATLLFGLAKFWPPFPMVIMGTVGTLAGVLALFFPETTGEELPETMNDAINIGKNSNFKMCSCNNA